MAMAANPIYGFLGAELWDSPLRHLAKAGTGL